MPATIYGLSLTERLGPNSVGRKVLLHVTQLTLTPGHPYFLPSGCGSRHSHLPPRGLQIHVTSVRGNDVPASPPTPTPTATACRGASLPRCMETLRSQYGGKMGDKPGACIIAPTGRGLDWAPVLQCSSALVLPLPVIFSAPLCTSYWQHHALLPCSSLELLRAPLYC